MSTNLKFLIAKLNGTSRRALESAANLALSRTHFEVDFEHVLLSLLDAPESDLISTLKAYDISPRDLQALLNRGLSSLKSGNNRNPVLAEQLGAWLETAWLLASIEFSHTSLRSGVLLLALRSNDAFIKNLGEAGQLLARLPAEDLKQQLPNIIRHSKETANATGSGPARSAPEDSEESAQRTSAATPALDKYTIDLTAQARAGKIDSVLGRDNEIRQMIDILLRRRQNNPILTGEPGVGKTAVVEGLATKIVSGAVPEPLKNVALRTLDLGLLQAGASVKGEFENRLRSVIDEVKASLTPVILFIDEAHTMIGAGGAAGQNDAANMLKPALARGELRTIAATTWAEYKKYFEKDAALARRFQVVKIDEPSPEIAVHMLRGVVPALEQHHRVRILDRAVVDAVDLSARYITGRQLPDKCLSVLDTACARVALSLAGKPAPLTDVMQLLENLEREEKAILRDGMSVSTQRRVEEIETQRQQLRRLLDELETDYAVQLELVQEVQRLRIEIAETADATADYSNDARRGTTGEIQAEPTVDKKKKTSSKKTADARALKLNKTLQKLQARHKERALVYECVDASTVAEVISGWTGIPLGRMVEDELAAVQQLGALLEKRVIGQDHALGLIAQRIQISKANLEDPGKPKGVFLLVGPSGVGKTETALALADTLYGGERNLITINMSEYQEAHSVAGLKGSPPGYVGYGEGGVLTEAVRRKPYSVVLLDEVEKAHPDVLELFFQVFDKGRLEDSEGNEVDFKNTVIILTSNVGTNLIMAATEHGIKVGDEMRAPTPADLNDLLRDDLQKHFKPAFLGRLVVVPYYPIQDDVLRRIIILKLEKVRNRIKENHDTQLDFDEKLVDLIAERCLDVDSGARNADAVITDTVLTALSVEILSAMAAKRIVHTITLNVEDGQLKIDMPAEEDTAQ